MLMIVAAGDGGGIDAGCLGLACRLLSARVVTATRNRVLQAQRKWTARCLPNSLVTGVRPPRAAPASDES